MTHEITDIRPGELLSVPEVSAMLGLSPITLANWRCTGQGPRWVKLGLRAVRYRRADVLDFIQAGTVETARAAA